jgi:hypothetical protein
VNGLRAARAIVVLLALAVSADLRGQGIPLSTLTGRVTSEDGAPLGGVSVRVTSPALQGSRETQTGAGGVFMIPLLPSGDYRVRFEARGLAPIERDVPISAAATVRVDSVLRPADVAESVTVAGELAPQRGTAVGTSISQKYLSELPSERTLRSAVLLAAGVNDKGPKGAGFLEGVPSAVMISGAPSFENLYLVNGVVVNDNYRGDPQNLFIEDAIAETVVETGRITAEYGRFTGGVVNVVTRSGGNRISGSFRTTFHDDAWTANDRYNRSLGIDNRVDDLSETYEATLGFPVWSDRVWGFSAGRWADVFHSDQTRADLFPGDVDPTPLPYVYGDRERRLEGKLTAAVTGSYNLIASYIDDRIEETNFAFDRSVLSTTALMPRSIPSSLLALNFNGVLSRNFFLEAQYSRRRSSVEQGGPRTADRVHGTFVFANDRGAGFGAPAISGEPANHFDNDSWLIKASYLLATPHLGEHDLRLGYERYRESSFTEFDFSRSGFWVNGTSAILRGNRIFPVFGDGVHAGETTISWFPLLAPPGWTRLVTHSAFFNDRLQWGKRWSFNLGVRWDRNHDRASDGLLVSTSDAWSPRLAVRYDPHGDGRFSFDAGYARYVTKLHPNLANVQSPAGNPAELDFEYHGPCLNCDSFAPTDDLLSEEEALRQLFAWFDAAGGTGGLPPVSAVSPNASRIVPGGLRSPTVREYSVGGTVQLGSRGSIAANYLYRVYRDLYDARVDLSTGLTPPDSFGVVYDVIRVGNSNALHRRYSAVQVEFRYRLAPPVAAGGSYTWAHLVANSVGEIPCCSAIPAHVRAYPEYWEERWNHPLGDATGTADGDGVSLSQDQRHRARLWTVWQTPIKLGRVSLAILESFDSGLGYDAVANIDSSPYVVNPGYAHPPTAITYYFTRPGFYRLENVTSTDLALDWSIPVHRSVELFLHAQVFNVFNEQSVVGVDRTVLTALDDPTLAPFDPFHETPVRDVNYRYGESFGKPTGPASYQQPRTFQVSVGLRF